MLLKVREGDMLLKVKEDDMLLKVNEGELIVPASPHSPSVSCIRPSVLASSWPPPGAPTCVRGASRCRNAAQGQELPIQEGEEEGRI